MHIISKSDYLKYLECPSYFWFWKNNKPVLSIEKENPFADRLKSQGYEVELFARNLYPNATLITGNLDESSSMTDQLIRSGTHEILQASFLVDDLFASCDILIWNDLFGGWDIIEVKSSTDKDKKSKEHILDAAFQRVVAEKAKYKIVNVYLLELNKEYYKDGDIDPNKIFNITEITTDCIELEQKILADIDRAKTLLTSSSPKECSCQYKGRSRHCRAFNYLYPKVPSYSIYDLRSIGTSKKVLRSLVEGNHLEIDQIPDEIDLNEKHSLQAYVTRTKDVHIEKEKIQNQFDGLIYPLYFLDYETLSCGIPKFENTYPYQQTVFQYSIHIVEQSGVIIHREYIHKDQTTPVHVVAQKLREDIGDSGSVIVWNKGFEGKCHKDLALVNPDLEPFLFGLNERMYDLMDVFRKMEYLHDDFKGSYSIKDVLPVMCPELSYDGLEVSNGTKAVVEYENLIFGDIAEELRESKFEALLEYCKLDTWAMVRIFQELQKEIKFL